MRSWHCYHRNLPYAKARELLRVYEELPETGELNEKLWAFMKTNPQMYLASGDQLLLYLGQLKLYQQEADPHSVVKETFASLYKDACRIVGGLLYEEPQEDISPADVEKVLCSGIPTTSSGNMMKMSASILSKQFDQKRMTRQRIAGILAGKTRVERFDLVTLLFLRYAEEVEPDWPAERYMRFIDEINEILGRCGMMDIYPVNPYESFILMCLLTDYPLAAYAEVWEQSYEQEQ